MSITVNREAVSFTVEHEDPLVEAALAMAELNRRWGHHGNPEALASALHRVVSSARMDSKVSLREIERLQLNSTKIQVMEELAASFRAFEDEGDGRLPHFQGELDHAVQTARDYAVALGCELVLGA